MFHFCTLFDHNYLTRPLVLFDSILEQTQAFRFYTLCTSNRAFKEIERLAEKYPQFVALDLEQLESRYPELLEAKANRSPIEYYFTLSPVLPLHVMDVFQPDVVTYLDADLCFYSHPGILFDELGENSSLLTEHRFSRNIAHFIKWGRFNVQYESFRNDQQGRACITRWRDQCLDWCYDRVDGNRFADQGYLDEWSDLYSKLVVSQRKTAGVALWNVSDVEIGLSHDKANFTIDGEPLVFFHFHSFKHLYKSLFVCDFSEYKVDPRKPLLMAVYQDYIRRLNGVAEKYGVDPRHTFANYRSRVPVILQLLKQAIKGNLIRTSGES